MKSEIDSKITQLIDEGYSRYTEKKWLIFTYIIVESNDFTVYCIGINLSLVLFLFNLRVRK